MTLFKLSSSIIMQRTKKEKTKNNRMLMMILEMTNFVAVFIGAINWLNSIDYTANVNVVDRLIWCSCYDSLAFDISNALHTVYSNFIMPISTRHLGWAVEKRSAMNLNSRCFFFFLTTIIPRPYSRAIVLFIRINRPYPYAVVWVVCVVQTLHKQSFLIYISFYSCAS